MKKIILFALLLSFPLILDSCKKKDYGKAGEDAFNAVKEIQDRRMDSIRNDLGIR